MIEASSLQEVKLYLGNSKMPVVLFLHAPWCGNCRSMYPVIQKFDLDYSDKVEFIKINIEDDKESADYFKVEGVPKFISFKNGRMIDSFAGANSIRLENMIKTL
jgi:thioredoxin 1